VWFWGDWKSTVLVVKIEGECEGWDGEVLFFLGVLLLDIILGVRFYLSEEGCGQSGSTTPEVEVR
jgi:hypothetical protein